MPTIESLLAFVAASTFLALAPGPDNLFVLTQSAINGVRAGLLVTLGICTGLIVHTIAVAVGIAAIVQTSAVAFFLLKIVGAGYLLYLAWQAFRSQPELIRKGDKPKVRAGKLFRRGILMNVANPKVSMFFLAFLPQFADPTRGSVTAQVIFLSVVFIGSTFFVFAGVAVLAGRINRWFAEFHRGPQFLNWIAGTIFIGLAVKLATARR